MTTVLTNAHLYMGTSQFGKVNEFRFPDIHTVMMESKPIDYIGKLRLPIGIELDGSSIRLNGFDAEVFKQLSDINKEHIITIRGNMKKFNGNALVDEIPVKGVIKALTKRITPLGSIRQQEGAEFYVELVPHSVKLEHKGNVLMEVDIANNIYIVDGVDQLAKMKVNLGLV
ncbi:phage major tail tube protein [bacterium]|nr:phage major tail tube protein [bacterium]